MLEQVKARGLCHELGDALCSYMTKNSSNSFSKISRLTGIDYKSLKKIESKNINLKNLHPLKVSKLAKLVLGHRCAMSFMKLFKSELNQSLVDDYLDLYSESLLGQVEHIDETKFKDHQEFEVFNLCANHGGISCQQVRELNGINGLHALERLLKRGIVECRDDRFFCCNDKFKFYDRDCIKEQVTEFSKKIKLNKKSKLRNYLLFAHESLNLKGIEELEKLTVKYQREVMDLMNDSFYQGENPYFLFLGYDSNIDKDYTSRRCL